MQSKVRSPIVVLMIIMAVVLGIGGFAFVSLLLNRPSTPASGTTPVTVNDVEVLVALNPDKTVEIVGLSLLENTEVVPPQPTADSLPAGNADAAATPFPTQPPLSTATPLPLPTTTPVPVKVIRIDYVVQANDSLYSIATRLDTSIALMAEYGLSIDDLSPGTTISLPVGNPAYCPGRRPYAVMEGDTAFSIARRVGITDDELQAINGLDANFTVYVADILCVP